MPQWAGSCWYYLRYLDPHNTKEFVSREKEKYWMPVGLYVGGAEHAVLHLLYARFWHKVLFDLGLVSHKEPFQRLVNQGLITSFAYQRKNKSLVPMDEVEEKDGKFVEKATGETVEQVIAKMSKSLKNVINPDDVIKEYGADSMRLYEMFMGPLQVSKPWSTASIGGVFRFLDRVWRFSEKTVDDGEVPASLLKALHKTIKKVSQDTGNLEFNTAISAMMIFVNEAYKADVLYRKAWEPFILLLAPYAPHVAEEIWSMLGHSKSLAFEPWPQWIEELTKDEEITVVFQINGKVRGKVNVSAGIGEEEMKEAALADEKVKEHISGKEILKVICIPQKLVNIVVR
jgi:leucyl-tRNA synthetase